MTQLADQLEKQNSATQNTKSGLQAKSY